MWSFWILQCYWSKVERLRPKWDCFGKSPGCDDLSFLVCSFHFRFFLVARLGITAFLSLHDMSSFLSVPFTSDISGKVSGVSPSGCATANGGTSRERGERGNPSSFHGKNDGKS